MAQSRRNSPKYVYDIPYFERMELCRVLDQNDKWEELGGVHMDFDVLTIQTLRREILRGNSPTDELLTKWGHQNHTILELFVLLSKMQHYQAMLIIKQFVDSEYHRLIYEGEQNLNRLFKPKENSNSLNNAHSRGMGTQNLDGGTDEKKIINGLNPTPLMGNELRNSSNRTNAQTALANRAALGNEAEGHNQVSSKFLKQDASKDKTGVSEISSIAESVGILPVITFKELEVATNGWDQSTILGKGGFGTVYKGTWKNTSVAIKRTRNSEANENHSVQIQQILGELKMLNSYRHDNILPLYGFSIDGEDPCLIYQYLPNGSLEDRLLCRHGTKPLSWHQRLNIATGTARGIQFLHTIGEKPLIHGDIKSANILLDLNFEPKIGDFGLAREGPYNHYTHMKVSRVHGTRPYLPDEFLRHKKFSTKVDTYSFGVVMFELATGLRAYDDQRQHKFLKDHVENTPHVQLGTLIDKKCGPDEQQTFSNLIALGKCCISRKPKDRPEMVVALQELNAMTMKRDMLVKVQSMIKQNSLTPTTPYEIQVFHDQLSQQKKISPYSSNVTNIRAPTRAISPLQPLLHPEAQGMGNAESLEAQVAVNASPINNFNNIQTNPFRAIDKNQKIKDGRSAVAGTSKESVGSGYNPKKMEVEEQKLQELNINELACKPPVISVSPPTLSHSSSSSSEEDPASPEVPPTEDLDYEITSDIEKFLPLISVLGVKAKSEESKEKAESRTEEREDEHEVVDVNTSATGKPLWILKDST
ncbi:hypothetical protein RUM43_004161 [Polyplax serrata]|uniref:non-specific serine/threonine protein kinase n=1 Tax=Polyplax serrata TaxID=468196 RepID=A0AAN8SBC5_POLSC